MTAEVQPSPGIPNQRSSLRLLVLGLFFFSGACGLVYQVVWVRMLTQVFGTTAAAVGVVLAAFMSGLALGGWLLGKHADRIRNPLRGYAFLEIGVGLAALAVHSLLPRITPTYVALYEYSGHSVAMLAAARFVLAFGLVMAPTFLMGATLPVLARAVIRRLDSTGVDLGRLYAVNTAGAVGGVLACGFYLIGSLGTNLTVYVAVAGNLLLGLVAWAASRHPGATLPPPEAAPAIREPAAEPLTAITWRALLIALFLSGLASFAYEIYWTRSLVFLLGNSTYALTGMLTAFISGIALGGYLAGLIADRGGDRLAIFGWIQLLIALSAAAALPLLFGLVEPQAVRSMLGRAAGDVELLMLERFGIALLVMLVPATLIGVTFPLAARIGITDLRHAGRKVGTAYASNTLGNVLGALLPGFVLLYWLGIQRGILLMAAINATVGLSILALRIGRVPHLRWAAPGAALVVLLALTRVPLDFQFPAENEGPSHRALYYRDGPSATTRVIQEPSAGTREMAVDGIVIGGNTFTEYKQLLLAHLPKLLLDDVSTELSIGLGSGMLAGESLRHEAVRSLTCVEIEPSVVEGARLFTDQNHAVLSDPRLHLVIDDISNYLRTRAQRYRVISADEKTSLDYAANGFSYSAEYYSLLRQHLAPGGIVIQWVPANLPAREYAMVLKTFSSSFPSVLMGFFMPALKESGYNTILVGSENEIILDSGRMQRVMRSGRTAFEGIFRYGLTTPESVIAQFVARGDDIRRAVRNAELNTLVHPRYEFYTPGDYAVPLRRRVAANLDFLAKLKRTAAAGLKDSVRLRDSTERERLDAALAAEQAYLAGYRSSLSQVDAGEIFSRYDRAIGLAPWNRNLRSRIALHYAEIAASQPNPAVKRYLRQRAAAVIAGD